MSSKQQLMDYVKREKKANKALRTKISQLEQHNKQLRQLCFRLKGELSGLKNKPKKRWWQIRK